MASTIELTDCLAGTHISHACEKAAALAESSGNAVHFIFNDTHVTVQPGESAHDAESRWSADMEAARKAWLESPERATQEAARAEDLRQKMAAHMTEVAQTESEMRDAKVPWPYTKEQLTEYIESLVNRSHDYGTCVYAMSMAAEAAFNHVSHCLGVTGFQASCANLDFIRRTRSMEVYPQYDLPGKLAEALEKWKPWLAEQAKKRLADTDHAHPNVVAHWKKLAAGAQ